MRDYSPYALFHPGTGAHSTLHVSLGYRDLPAGRFSMWDILTRRGVPVLFLNCPNTWYLQGVPGFADDTQSLLARIERLARRIKANRVEFLGASMGGTAAIRLGVEYGADRITAINPEIRLGLRYSQSVLDLDAPRARAARAGLAALRTTRPHRIRALVSDADAVDVVNMAALVALLPADLLLFPGRDHHVAEHLALTGKLDFLLFGGPATGSRDLRLLDCHRGHHHAPPMAAGMAMLRAYHDCRLGRFARGLAHLAPLDATAPGHAAVGFLRGWALTELGDIPGAIEAFFDSRRHNPRSVRFCRALSQALLSAGRAEEAVMALSWVLEEPHPDRVALVALADALAATNRMAEAEEVRGRAG
ncbi:hypothetical protein [Falsiroseomonas ponticola]|uniref:hypothetical protein n=1 Tax=Falsiroseomonas ponticola TaxID=2786951 RepID=UPI001934AA49|nr:hypothetical protein [Roseomonas ponticola]